MTATRIGKGRCLNPKCRSPNAHYTVSKKGLLVITCNACQLQAFTRSERSDEDLREGLITREGEPAPDPAPAPVPEPANTPAPAPSPAPATAKSSRSFLSWASQ